MNLLTFPAKCSFGDHNCIKEAINEVISKCLESGIPDVNLKQLDPLTVKDFLVEPNPGSSLSLYVSLSSGVVRGFRNMRAYDVKGFERNLTGPHVISFKSPALGIHGDYQAKGKVAMLPFSSQGKGGVELSKFLVSSNQIKFILISADLEWGVSFSGQPEIRDGKTFMGIKNFKISEKSIRKCVIQMGQILGIMTPMLNDFFNENWREFHDETKQSIQKNFEKILVKYVQDVFYSRPYEEFFKSS